MKGTNAWERATWDCLTSGECWKLDGEINTRKTPRGWCEYPAQYLSLRILLWEPMKTQKSFFLWVTLHLPSWPVTFSYSTHKTSPYIEERIEK